MGTTEDLAGWLTASRPDDIPADVVHEARRALVNIVGCALGGAPHPAVDITIDALGAMFGPPDAAVLGRPERADPLHAALLNGITSHVEDFDDTLPRNYIHASSPVASALLALREREPRLGPRPRPRVRARLRGHVAAGQRHVPVALHGRLAQHRQRRRVRRGDRDRHAAEARPAGR